MADAERLTQHREIKEFREFREFFLNLPNFLKFLNPETPKKTPSLQKEVTTDENPIVSSVVTS